MVSSGPVAFIISLKDGVPSFINRDIESLTKRGIDIHLYATKSGTGIYAPSISYETSKVLAILRHNITLIFQEPRIYFTCLRRAVETRTMIEFAIGASYAVTMKKRLTRLIHCTFGDRKLFVGYYSSILLNLPLTVQIHSHELSHYINHPIFAAGMNTASKVFTVSKFNESILKGKYPEAKNKIELLRLSVDGHSFSHDSRIKVLTVAKFHTYKGYDTLVGAAEILREEPIVFWIVGEGPVDVVKMIEDKRLRDKFRILGSVNEELLRIVYDSCDVFCLPSKTAPDGQREGLPVSIMEAMLFAKPVVSTKHAGIPELVPSILVDEGDSSKLADALMTYSANPSLRKSDGLRNREIALRDHSENNLDAFERQIRRLSENGRHL